MHHHSYKPDQEIKLGSYTVCHFFCAQPPLLFCLFFLNDLDLKGLFITAGAHHHVDRVRRGKTEKTIANNLFDDDGLFDNISTFVLLLLCFF